jgi:AcrR family transcriptional regulator
MKITELADPAPGRRTTLTRDRVLAAAVQLADRDGIDSVSMRRLAHELGIEAMSLYTHVRNKDDLLDGMVDAVIGEIPVDPADGDWKASLRQTVSAARTVILRHPWAPRVIETRTSPGPAVPQYFDGVIGILRRGGFSIEAAHHALHILGSRLLGFTQDLFDDSGDLSPEAAEALAGELGDRLPYVAEMALAVSHDGDLGGCDDDAEFEIGLNLILDGLERLATPKPQPGASERA